MSWIERDYILETGQGGHDSYQQGYALWVVDFLIYYQLGIKSIVRSLNDRWDRINSKWTLNAVCDVTSLTPTQITQLDSFMNGPNNTVIGLYPPRLLNPAITFVKIATVDQDPFSIADDLVGRGLLRSVLVPTIQNVLEYWYPSAMTAGQKNQIKNMWANRLIDVSTGKPL